MIRGVTATTDGHSNEQVNFHVHLMSQAGLVDAANISARASNYPQARVMAITWSGYEFLESACSDTAWQRAKKLVIDTTGGTALGILLSVLSSIATSAVSKQL